MEDYSNIKAVIYLGYKLPGDAIDVANHVTTIDDINIEIVEPAQSVVFTGIEDVIAFSGRGFQSVDRSGPHEYARIDVTNRIEVLGFVPNEIQVASEYFRNVCRYIGRRNRELLQSS
ncbi:MAG: hypothetical protein MZU97_23115 [Bacillus subtilis]|nr:hypothetical protein [Bacillus subtilis]